MPRQLKKALAWGFWGANLAIIIAAWLTGVGWVEITSGDGVTILHGLGLLFGLTATYCALVQFVLMGRVGWLEPIFGLDRLAIFHRGNGIATLLLVLLHFIAIYTSYTIWENDWLTVFGWPYIWLALIALIILIITVGASIYIVRKHLKFETWYAVHVCNYLFKDFAIEFIGFDGLFE